MYKWSCSWRWICRGVRVPCIHDQPCFRLPWRAFPDGVVGLRTLLPPCQRAGSSHQLIITDWSYSSKASQSLWRREYKIDHSRPVVAWSEPHANQFSFACMLPDDCCHDARTSTSAPRRFSQHLNGPGYGSAGRTRLSGCADKPGSPKTIPKRRRLPPQLRPVGFELGSRVPEPTTLRR